MWKTAVLGALLTLAAAPALAADAASGAAATAKMAPATVSMDQAPGGIQKLTERVVALEKRMDQLGVADPPPAPTPDELRRAKLAEEQHQEFLNEVWSTP
jgi:hypothetical protein